MRLHKISSDEQPTQEIHLDTQSTLTTLAEQKPIQDMDTELLLAAPLPVEQDKQEQLPSSEIHLEQQETLPIVSIESTLKHPSRTLHSVGQGIQEQEAPLSSEKKHGRRYSGLLWWVKLAQDGMQISSHTIHHVNIGQPPSWTTTQSELLVSKKHWRLNSNNPFNSFAIQQENHFITILCMNNK
ncbi:MAG: hypothetical protein ACXWOL_06855 [Ktedonobacteraceae bacterium]